MNFSKISLNFFKFGSLNSSIISLNFINFIKIDFLILMNFNEINKIDELKIGPGITQGQGSS